MSSSLQEFDPFISRKLKRDIDYYEIRGENVNKIQDWIADTLIREQLLGLLRTGFISIVGWNEKNEPIFEQSDLSKPIL